MNSAEMLKGTSAVCTPRAWNVPMSTSGKKILARSIHAAAMLGVPGLKKDEGRIVIGSLLLVNHDLDGHLTDCMQRLLVLTQSLS